jgi:hypothetical protein
MTKSPLTIAVILLQGVTVAAHARSTASISPPWIWWEAEAPKSTNFPTVNPFAPTDEKAAKGLSNGAWIGAVHPDKALFLEYEVRVPKAGAYRFYARKFWRHGPFRWRFDDQPWRDCGRDVALLDDVSISKFVGANWVAAGTVDLKAGVHTVRIELDKTTDAAAFDCFLLTGGPFTPRGKLKPGEKVDTAPPGWFAFEPDSDPFNPTALDLRSLNEAFAGEQGFIQVKGDSFVHEKTGQRVRFWAVNIGDELLGHNPADLDHFARRLAKLGVNMVRLQTPLWREDDVTRVDPAKLDGMHRLVAALKKQGIYLTLSSFWPYWLAPKGLPGLEGLGGDKRAFALPFFNTRLQELQRSWWRDALTVPNPYTGVPLVRDPTLAFIEILNEDGMFFWTFAPYTGVPAPQMVSLEKLFGRWLETRYGGVERAFSSWSGGKILEMLGRGKVTGDDASAGRAGFMPLYEMLDRRDARARDTAEFLAGLQRGYYDQMYGYLKNDLGFKGSVTGSNWITADARVLGPLDKWSNAGCDFMDRHGYYSGPHEGERAGYAISSGDRYNDASALLFETGDKGQTSFNVPVMDLAYNGKPSTISEINWTPPNRARADLPVIAAAYGALQGSDAFFFFQAREIDWAQALGKFSIADPVAMGQFPATALIFREGLVKTAGVALGIESRLSDLYQLKGIPISAPQNLDTFRKHDIPAGQAIELPQVGSIDPLAFLTGRVEVNVTETGGLSKAVDLSSFIDRERKIVRSITGELSWDYGRGLVTIDAPAAQGATGFLAKAGRLSLADLTIESSIDYGSILLVAMDGRPLASSRRMLLQVMSEDTNSGWSAPGTGVRSIVDVGGPPLVVKNLDGHVSLKRADASTLKVRALDFNGYATGTKLPAKGARDIALSPKTFYYLVEK